VAAIRRQLTAQRRLNPIQSESNPNPNPNPTRKREDIAAVVDAYLNKISPTPSQTSLEELTAYVNTMGKDCCLRAIDKALDAGVRNWYYVRKVLRVKASQGVRCLADWDAIDEKNEKLGGRVYGETAIGSSTQDSPYHLEALEL
jgi:DNA replication protein DnaD